MPPLLDLPTELLLAILSQLAHTSFPSFITAQRTCKTLHTNITSILEKPTLTHTHAIRTFLNFHFSAILDTSSIVQLSSYYQHGNDKLAPFRALPWASGPQFREKYLRPEASWRQIPLVSENGAIMRSLQIVMITSDDFPDEIDGLTGEDVVFLPKDGNEDETVYEPHGDVTIGALFDVIIGLNGIYPNPIGGGWKVLFETRVSDRKEFREIGKKVWRGEGEITRREIERDLFARDGRCALLFTTGGWINSSRPWSDEDEEAWQPMAIDHEAQIGLPFQ